MFKIARFPSKFNNFFSSLKIEFSFGHFEYFKMLVLLISFVWERRNIALMYRYLDTTSFPQVSDDPGFCAKEIITSYDVRWSIEVFFKDVKLLLGFGQYQNRAYKAAVPHLHLVCFTYALLTHLAIERNGALEKKNKAVHVSVRDLQHSLRRIV